MLAPLGMLNTYPDDSHVDFLEGEDPRRCGIARHRKEGEHLG